MGPLVRCQTFERAIQRHLLDRLALEVLEGAFHEGDTVLIERDGSQLVFRTREDAPEIVAAASSSAPPEAFRASRTRFFLPAATMTHASESLPVRRRSTLGRRSLLPSPEPWPEPSPAHSYRADPRALPNTFCGSGRCNFLALRLTCSAPSDARQAASADGRDCGHHGGIGRRPDRPAATGERAARVGGSAHRIWARFRS